MIGFWNAFVKITGWLPQKLVFRTRVLCEDRAAQGRRIRGPAIVVCNHTSVWDLAALLFVFFSRTLRFQIAELQFEKKVLGRFLRLLGGIRVDRDSYNFDFIAKSEEVLRRGGVVAIFPEGRLPQPGEERPLPFKTSAAFLALASGAPVIPVWTDGRYFARQRAHVMIGRPLEVSAWIDPARDDRENLALATEHLRDEVIRLERLFYERTEQNKK